MKMALSCKLALDQATSMSRESAACIRGASVQVTDTAAAQATTQGDVCCDSASCSRQQLLEPAEPRSKHCTVAPLRPVVETVQRQTGCGTENAWRALPRPTETPRSRKSRMKWQSRITTCRRHPGHESTLPSLLHQSQPLATDIRTAA